MVGAEELLRARRRHRGRGRDLERKRRRGDDLREAVDLARARAAHQGEPRARVGEGRPASDRADLEPRQPDRAVQAALDPPAGAVRHRARSDHPQVLARGRKDGRNRRGRRERDGLHAGGDSTVRPGPGELCAILDARLQDPPDGLRRERAFRQHGLAVPAALEVPVRRLLVAAHVRFEDCPPGLHRRVLHHVADVQGVGVASHHVRPAGVAGRERPHHVAHRPDDMRLDLAQLRVLGESRLRLDALREPAAHLCDVSVEEARERDGLLGRAADEARGARDPVAQDVGAEAARLRGGSGTAEERRRESSFGVRERNVDVLLGASDLHHLSDRLLELVFTDRDRKRADHRDGDHGHPGQRLLRFREGFEVVREHLAVVGQRPQLVLAGLDRLGIVLPRPASQFHDAELMLQPMATGQVTEEREEREAYAGVLRFYELAKKQEWQVGDLPWGELPPIPEAKGPPEKQARRNDVWRSVITQQLQADELACEMSSQLLNIAPDPEAKLYYSTMVQDESRHTEAWLKLIDEAGGSAERDPHLDELAHMTLEADTVEEKVFQMQVFYERLIISRFRLIARASRGTVLEDLCNRLTTDDGIHHGAGMEYEKVLLQNASKQTKQKLIDAANRLLPTFVEHALWRPKERAFIGRAMHTRDIERLKEDLEIGVRLAESLGLDVSEVQLPV